MTNTTEQSKPREIWQIARDIRSAWKKPYFGAVPYLHALGALTTADSRYGVESARDIVIYFLANATLFRGERARTLKAELKAMFNIK
jgi:hypothetical protein